MTRTFNEYALHRFPDRERGRLSPGSAALIAGGAWLASGLVGRLYSPDPTHPDIRRWYKSLRKPSYKPPDAVFAAPWPVFTALHAAGAYRLMRSPRTPERDAALVFWALSLAMVGGWAKLFFGERSLTGGAAGGAVMVAAGLAYVERANRVDGAAALLGVPYTALSAFGGFFAEELRERNADLDGRDPSWPAGRM